MGLNSNPQRTKEIIRTLMEWSEHPDGFMSGADMPESAPPEGMTRGSYEHVLWLTLTVSIDYQRNATSLWNAAKLTWNDHSTRWVFYPHTFKDKKLENLVIALSRYRLSQKPNNDAKTWWKVATSFQRLFEGDPQKLLESLKWDALEIYHQMRSKYKKDFPFLSGNKILLLWIRMLKDEANIDLSNLDKIKIPIDIHTARASITTGCLVGNFEGNFEDLATQSQDAWEESCKSMGLKYYPLQLDAPLWNLSRLGCINRNNGSVCPLRHECKLSKYCTVNAPDAIVSLSNRGKIQVRTVYPNIGTPEDS
jgi:hypothetical protein